MPTIDLLAPADASALLAERPEWTSSVFTTPVWWNNALRILTQGCEVRLAAITEGDRTVGLLGVTIDRERGLSQLIGDPISDHVGPLHAASDRVAVAAELPGLLDALLPSDLPFRTDGLHPDFRHADPRATVVDVPCPLVRLDRSWAEYLAQPGGRRRRHTGGRRSRGRRCGGLVGSREKGRFVTVVNLPLVPQQDHGKTKNHPQNGAANIVHEVFF